MKNRKIVTGLFATVFVALLAWGAKETQLGNLYIKNYALDTTLQVETLLTRATLALKTASGTAQMYKDEGVEKIYSTVEIVAPAFTGYLTGDVTGNAGTVTVADTTDTTCSVGLFESATGSLGGKTDGGLTYNASTGVLSATGFSGPLTGNVIGNLTGSLIAPPISTRLCIRATTDASFAYFADADGNAILTVDSVNNKIGIGTETPNDYYAGATNLVIAGTGADGAGLTFVTPDNKPGWICWADGTGAAAYAGSIDYNHSTNAMRFATGGALRLTISSTGVLYSPATNATAGEVTANVSVGSDGKLAKITSSARYKKDIKKTGAESAKLLNLQAKDFVLKHDTEGKKHTGLIAEDVDKELPQVVIYEKSKNARDRDKVATAETDDLIPDGLDWNAITALLIEENKRQESFIKALETRIEKLEAK